MLLNFRLIKFKKLILIPSIITAATRILYNKSTWIIRISKMRESSSTWASLNQTFQQLNTQESTPRLTMIEATQSPLVTPILRHKEATFNYLVAEDRWSNWVVIHSFSRETNILLSKHLHNFLIKKFMALKI